MQRSAASLNRGLTSSHGLDGFRSDQCSAQLGLPVGPGSFGKGGQDASVSTRLRLTTILLHLSGHVVPWAHGRRHQQASKKSQGSMPPPSATR